MSDDQPLFDRVDGEAFFVRLVDRFYAGVMNDPLLAPLYPAADIDGARWRLAAFLVQYWGGPTTYGERRGHPRLRMRHAPFAIGGPQRDAWLRHMGAALYSAEADQEIAAEDAARMRAYFQMAAEHMVNRPGG